MKSLIAIILINLFFQTTSYAQVLVISDIDDTIKLANTQSKRGLIYYSARRDIFKGLKYIYQDIKSYHSNNTEQVIFKYVTSAPKIIMRSDDWPLKQGFPHGLTYERNSIFDDSFSYKYSTIFRIIEDNLKKFPELKVYFFGDNSENDHIIYKKINDYFMLNAKIFIRDVTTQTTDWDYHGLDSYSIDGINFFLSELELINHSELKMISHQTKKEVQQLSEQKKLIPSFIRKSLSKRLRILNNCPSKSSLKEYFSCKKVANKVSKSLFNDYYLRFQTDSVISAEL